MDYLKIYSSNTNHLDTLLRLVHKISSEMGMTFVINQCQTVFIIGGKLVQGTDVKLDAKTTISAMEETPYKLIYVLLCKQIK